MRRVCVLLLLLCCRFTPLLRAAEPVTPRTIRTQGLRSVNHQGSFPAAAYLPDGSVVLLWDQGDGLRLLHASSDLTNIFGEAHLGAAGDHGTALVTDGNGNLFVGGTSTSGQLSGTPGVPFPAAIGSSLNPFIARFNSQLQLSFLSFLGAGQTSLAGIAVGSDAILLTGVTYSASFPITPGAVIRQPAQGVQGNGYVISFAADGSRLRYSTYLTADGGTTAPAVVAAGPDGSAIVVGSTSSPFFPTVAALQPSLSGSTSGFLSRLTPAGDAFVFSTFIAGNGLASVAFDGVRQQIVATGDLSAGAFPLGDTLAPLAPLAAVPSQSLLRLSLDGQTLLDSRVLLPGTAGSVVAGVSGDTWITGSLSFPSTQEQDASGTGSSYLLHLDAGGHPDALSRFGGNPANHAGSSSLQTTAGAVALSPQGDAVLVPGNVQVTADPSFAADQRYSLFTSAPQGKLLPNSPADLLPPLCTGSNSCDGSAGLLLQLTAPSAHATLALDTAGSPGLTLRNLSQVSLDHLRLSSSAGPLTSSCTPALAPGDQCDVLASNPSAFTLSATGNNLAAVTFNVPAQTSGAITALALNRAELNFGLASAASGPTQRILGITNLTSAPVTFASAPANIPSGARYTLAEAASNCDGPAVAHVLPPGSSCSLTIALEPSLSSNDDSPVHASWLVGGRALPVTGYAQANALALSTQHLDFGLQTTAPITQLPRFLYLSNLSTLGIPHSTVTTPADSPFNVEDDCPALLEPGSVCQISVIYQQTTRPALDTTTIDVDGEDVLLTGQTAPASLTAPASTAAPFSVSSSRITFAAPTLAGTISAETQMLQVRNGGSQTLPFTASLLGDFKLQNPCGTSLAPGDLCTLTIGFAPSQTGVRTGLLTLSAGSAFAVSTVPISGTGVDLASLGADVDLGQTTVAEPLIAWYRVASSSLPLTVTASGTAFQVAVAPAFGGAQPVVDPTQFAQTASAQCSQCWIGVRFLPTAPGSAAGVLTVSADAQGNPYMVHLRAAALPSQGLLLSPGLATLPSTPVSGTSAPVDLTLINALPSTSPVSLSDLTLDPNFQRLPADDPSDCGATLAPTASCRLRLVFTPTALGPHTTTLPLHTSQGDAQATLTGIGTPDPGLSLRPDALAFATTGAQTVTLTNTSASSLIITGISADAPAFQPTSTCGLLGSHASCTVTVAYTASSLAGTASLTLQITQPNLAGTASAWTFIVPLTGSGSDAGALSVFPTSVDFGASTLEVPGPPRQIRFTNHLSSPVSVTLAATHDFPLATVPACGTVAPGASCDVSVLFLPQSAGPLSGTLTAVATTPDGTLAGATSAALRGYAAGSGSLAPDAGATPGTPVSFGSVASGATAAQTIHLRNSGAGPVSLRGLSTGSPFQITASTCVGMLSAGQTCNVVLQYAPAFLGANDQNASQAPRTDSGTLLVENTGAAELLPIYLQGTVLPRPEAATADVLPTFTLSGSALTFLQISGQATPAQSITVRNTGTVPLTVSGITVDGAFVASSDCATLQAGDTCSLRVSFQPAAALPALRSGTLLIASDAAQALSRVTLLGPPSPACRFSSAPRCSTSAASPSALPHNRPSRSPTRARSPSLSKASPSRAPLPSPAAPALPLAVPWPPARAARSSSASRRPPPGRKQARSPCGHHS